MSQHLDAFDILASYRQRDLLEEAARLRLADALALDNGPTWELIGTTMRRVCKKLRAALIGDRIARLTA